MKKILVLLLALTMALSLFACADKAGDTEATAVAKDGDVLGEGASAFALEITGKDGETIAVTVNTDAKTVGEALLAVELIAGEESEYGLYVTTVNGETLSWEEDALYWAFYIDGEYATTGVDMTDVTAGASYALKAEG
ncbi:MAG: DUF4430 domain-containing protein [Clostridiales bacterium]|nr:DUF4430 domain-containing protein [Clostridiales bacterium]